ncbi:uncharacterized protein LOC126799358 [Argentina anserina]|uniref:uncharacterized protein LOC126799358 n=1 Tax=Argentina anserina TaxID=57926 RepID=UPI0021765C8F|nr:uncharacterized protein LOC126799358 [Potentilla anserina]
MALQTGSGISTSQVLVLVGAGLTSSIILRNGKLSDLLAQLQELCKGVNEVEILPEKFDSSVLRAQIQKLSEEIRELTVAGPVAIYNGNSDSGSYASYLIPVAALGAMGYCYMKWKGWSLSDVMYVTKHNMANAVATVSKQLETVHETLAITRRHLTKKLEELDWKVEEQRETTHLIANGVNEVKSNLSQIEFDVDAIHQLVSGLEGKVELLESKQDITNAGLWYLCQVAEGSKDRPEAKTIQDVSAKLTKHLTFTSEDKSLKGLQFIAETKDTSVVEKSTTRMETNDPSNFSGQKVSAMKTRIHRSFPVGISLHRNMTSSDS